MISKWHFNDVVNLLFFFRSVGIALAEVKINCELSVIDNENNE